jgi:hypothetical protein
MRGKKNMEKYETEEVGGWGRHIMEAWRPFQGNGTFVF